MAYSRDNDPAPPPDFGFYYPFDYLAKVMPIVEASDYASLPRAGGLDDQCPYFLEDLNTWLRLKRFYGKKPKLTTVHNGLSRGDF